MLFREVVYIFLPGKLFFSWLCLGYALDCLAGYSVRELHCCCFFFVSYTLALLFLYESSLLRDFYVYQDLNCIFGISQSFKSVNGVSAVMQINVV